MQKEGLEEYVEPVLSVCPPHTLVLHADFSPLQVNMSALNMNKFL